MRTRVRRLARVQAVLVTSIVLFMVGSALTAFAYVSAVPNTSLTSLLRPADDRRPHSSARSVWGRSWRHRMLGLDDTIRNRASV